MCKSGSGGEKGESVSGSTEKPKKMWKGGEGDEMSGVTLSMYYSRVSGEPKRKEMQFRVSLRFYCLVCTPRVSFLFLPPSRVCVSPLLACGLSQ